MRGGRLRGVGASMYEVGHASGDERAFRRFGRRVLKLIGEFNFWALAWKGSEYMGPAPLLAQRFYLRFL